MAPFTVAFTVFNRFLECLEQVIGGTQNKAEVCLSIKGILPVHNLDPALYFSDVTM